MIQDGWLVGAKRVVSPHFNQRPSNLEVSLLVIHNISLPPFNMDAEVVEQFFAGTLDFNAYPQLFELKELKVSSHLYISRLGEVTQFVPFNQRAWHAGVSQFQGNENCNDFSIGIEMAGADLIPYTEAQYKKLVTVTKAIQTAYPLIDNTNIVGHSDIAPGRKTDPGESFDWVRYKMLLE